MAGLIERPRSAEYPEFHAGYVGIVPEGDVLEILERQLKESTALLSGIDEAHGGRRYAPGKWTVKEVVGHVVDIERVFAYRAMRIARKDRTPLPGVEQDDLVAGGDFAARTLAGLIEEFRHQRLANLALFRSLEEPALARRGKTDTYTISVRALVFVVAGHERHHMQVLRERYLQQDGTR